MISPAIATTIKPEIPTHRDETPTTADATATGAHDRNRDPHPARDPTTAITTTFTYTKPRRTSKERRQKGSVSQGGPFMFRNPFKRHNNNSNDEIALKHGDRAANHAVDPLQFQPNTQQQKTRGKPAPITDPMSIAAIAGFDPNADEPIREQDPAADTLISVEHLGSTAVATIIQPELMGDTAEQLGAELVSLLRNEPKASNLVIDFQDVEYIDSACLNMFIRLMGTFRDHGGKIAIASCKDRVEGLFRLTRLDQLFPVRRSVLDAVETLERKAA